SGGTTTTCRASGSPTRSRSASSMPRHPPRRAAAPARPPRTDRTQPHRAHAGRTTSGRRSARELAVDRERAFDAVVPAEAGRAREAAWRRLPPPDLVLQQACEAFAQVALVEWIDAGRDRARVVACDFLQRRPARREH